MAFISGPQVLVGIQDLHLHLHGGLLAIGFGRNLGDHAVPFEVRKRVDGHDALLLRARAGEIVLRDVEFDLQIDQIGQRDDRPCGPPSAPLANCDVINSPFSALRSRIVPLTGARTWVASSCDFA